MSIHASQADVGAVAGEDADDAVCDVDVDERDSTSTYHSDGIEAPTVNDRRAHTSQREAIDRDGDRTRTDTGKTDDRILIAGVSHGVGERFLAAIEDIVGVRGRRARQNAEEDEPNSEISHIGTSRFNEDDDSPKRWQGNRTATV